MNIGLAERALDAAGVGGWELDIACGRLSWTSVTFAIHEVDPNYQPALTSAIDFYRADARPIIEGAVKTALATGAPWDLELPLITAKGRHIWVRACGCAIHEHGKAVRLTGAFQDVTARREMNARIERLSLVAKQMTNAIIITNAQGRTEWVNDAFSSLTGFAMEDMAGREPGKLLQGADSDRGTVDHMRACVASARGFEVEIINYTRAGEPYWIGITCTPLRDDGGQLTGFIAVESDVTARRTAEAETRREALERQRAEALLRDVLEALPSSVSAFDADEKLILTNRAYTEFFPINARVATPGRSLTDILNFGAAHGQYPEVGPNPIQRQRWVAAALASHRAPGKSRTFMLPNGRFVQARERRSKSGILVCIRSDATELKHAEANLRVLAERDSMTGLANRATFLADLNRLLESDGEVDGAAGALVMFDIDHFKSINDSLGHDVGDALLIEIAARLRATTRSSDLPARLGGDEFALIMPGLTDPDLLAARMDLIQRALAAPMKLGRHVLSVSSSAGVTVFPRDGTTSVRLFKTADLALYEAKRTGRDRWSTFKPEYAQAVAQQASVAAALRAALDAGAIEVAFHPRRLLRGGHAGFEVLACWHDGTCWVPLGDFMPVAEDAALVLQLGGAVLAAALARMQGLRDQGLEPGQIAVKVSAAQLLHVDFVDQTQDLLRRYGGVPTDLELEITEDVLLGRSSEQALRALEKLRALGFAVAVGGFGTGCTSLAQLARLPVDRLKIDRSFLDDLGPAAPGGAVVRTIIALCRHLGMESVAVEVRTRMQLAFLEAEGCQAVQGYPFIRPLLSLDDTAVHLQGDAAARQFAE